MSFKDWTTGENPSADDFDQIQRQGINSFADAAARDAASPSGVGGVEQAGMMTVLTDDGIFTVWNEDLSDWVEYGRYKAWGVYTPVLTATTTNPTLGSGGTAFGRWNKEGTNAVVAIFMKFGASGVGAGSGTYEISLPAECPVESDWFGANEIIAGNGIAIDNSTNIRNSVAVKVVNSLAVRIEADGLTEPVTHSNLIAWDTNDLIVSATIEYETED
jgi:hypothetical protein